MKEKNLYQLLGISFDAEQSSIDVAYRQLALLYHPDRNHADEAVALMAEINHAYEILGNPEKRKKYDRDHVYLRSYTKAAEPVKPVINQQDWVPRAETQAPAQQPVLIVQLHHHPYAVQLDAILGVLPSIAIRWVEEKPVWVKGVLEYRGRFYPTADLRELLDLSVPEDASNEPFILCNIHGMPIALQIDKALRTYPLAENEIKAVPNLGEDLTFSFVNGLFLDGEQVVLYLNLEGLFTEAQWQELQAFVMALV